jgi:hypothetical protein
VAPSPLEQPSLRLAGDELENLTPEEFRELLEDFADGQAAREALAEAEAGAEPVPAEQVGRNSASNRDAPAIHAVRPS